MIWAVAQVLSDLLVYTCWAAIFSVDIVKWMETNETEELLYVELLE